jgi:hypothetical protein
MAFPTGRHRANRCRLCGRPVNCTHPDKEPWTWLRGDWLLIPGWIQVHRECLSKELDKQWETSRSTGGAEKQ